MLDDLKFIHEKDANDALGVAERQSKQLLHQYDVPHVDEAVIKHVVYAGMGGSALAAGISQSWPGYQVPFEICRTYNLPQYVNHETLVIAASYSGNTEETLSALAEAEERGAHIAVIAGGGKLTEIAKEKHYTLLTVPKAEQPRYAVFYNFMALLAVLEAYKLVSEGEVQKQVSETAAFLEKAVQVWVPTVPSEQNPAKQLAKEIMGKTPVIYAGPLMTPAAYKWKISFNENAKNVAWCGQYPEFNHNEFIGWSSHPVQKPYAVIDLRSSFEHERVQKRFEISDRMLSGMRPAAHVVEAQGETLLEHLLWTVTFGDFVSLYVALLNGVNPAPVELVEKFKKELG